MAAVDSFWANAQVGRVLGKRWALRRLLGVGGTAAVYEAQHRNGKRVAIKILNPRCARDPRSRRRFLRQAYAANSVGHACVVTIDDDGEEPDGTTFLVMELARGESLDTFARRAGGRLSWQLVTQLLMQLLSVLEAAHARGIVHRDIKPGNLVWSEDRLRVLDFGIARFAEGVRCDEGAERRGDARKRGDAGKYGDDLRTHEGALLGTPAFMAPEQARAAVGAIGPHTDVWAAGATAFALIAGRRVYDVSLVDDQIAFAASSSAPALKLYAPEVPDAVAEVIQRALAYDCDARWPSARAMLDALQSALGQSGIEESPAHDAHLGARDARDTLTAVDSIERSAAGSRHTYGKQRSFTLPLLVGVVSAVVTLGWVANRTWSPVALSAHPAPAAVSEPLVAIVSEPPLIAIVSDPSPGAAGSHSPSIAVVNDATPDTSAVDRIKRAVRAPKMVTPPPLRRSAFTGPSQGTDLTTLTSRGSAAPVLSPNSALELIEEPPF